MSAVAKTILEQLGGNKFAVMTGAKGFYAGSSELQFSLPGNPGFVKDGINKVVISLDPSDTYTVTFYRVAKKGLGAKVKASFSDVYCDALRGIFERTTGLRTSLTEVYA
jgi:hypothetical protein